MVTRWVTAVALCLALAGVAPVARADSTRLVIRGDHSAVMDFSFTEPTRLKMQAVEVSGGASWAGLVIEPVGHQPPLAFLAALHVKSIHGSDGKAHKFAGMTEFETGRYRVRLLTNGPVEFVLHVVTGGRVLKPTRRIAATARAGQAAADEGLSNASTIRLPGAVPAGRRSLLLYTVPGFHAEDTNVCLTTTWDCPDELLPSPNPESPTLLLPGNTNTTSVMAIDQSTSTTSRTVVLTTQGLRVQAATVRLFSLAYA